LDPSVAARLMYNDQIWHETRLREGKESTRSTARLSRSWDHHVCGCIAGVSDVSFLECSSNYQKR